MTQGRVGARVLRQTPVSRPAPGAMLMTYSGVGGSIWQYYGDLVAMR
jgi:hypothetical protein